MPFGIAWSIVPSPAFEQSFVQHHWRMRAGWSADDWALNLVVVHDGGPIGSQSIHARNFPVLGEVSTGSWLGAPFHRQGFGTEMRAAVLALAFGGLGAEVALSEAFLDNLGSSGVSRALGLSRERPWPIGAAGRHPRHDAVPPDRRRVARPRAATRHDRGSRLVPRPLRGGTMRHCRSGGGRRGQNHRRRDRRRSMTCINLGPLRLQPARFASNARKRHAGRQIRRFRASAARSGRSRARNVHLAHGFDVRRRFRRRLRASDAQRATSPGLNRRTTLHSGRRSCEDTKPEVSSSFQSPSPGSVTTGNW